MRRHIAYLKYILRHKYFVFIAGMTLGKWFVFHDMSKFLPSEWFPYAFTFYDVKGQKRYHENEDFNQAWNAHQKRNKHHWQYWLLKMDRGDVIALDMPHHYIFEMVADWAGAGRAITGKWEVKKWYESNKQNIIISDTTREIVELLLNNRKF